MKPTNATHSRIDFRTTQEIKSLIERAASLRGMTIGDFANSVLVEKSYEVISSNEIRILSDEDRDRFLSLLDATGEPIPPLVALADRFKQAVSQRDIIV